MCGISVFLGCDAVAGRNFVERANRLLSHRGPDDEGLFVGDGVALGHRRLSIVDLSAAGHQPMISHDGRWVIVYNGEVYNHLELRSKLCQGWSFRSRTDTETVLAALALHGPAAFEQMVGMWSLALWDTQKQQLLVSRDRYGQKPLYWRRTNNGAIKFASEIGPLLEREERPEAYPPALAEYLATGNYGHLGEKTFFRDIYSFPPAHWALISKGDLQLYPHKYWHFPIAPEDERRPYDGVARRRFRVAFEEAVSSQLMSDVPVGATLSGGLDSSAVVGAMANYGTNGPIPVFTAQANGSHFDESCYVKTMEKHYAGRLHIEWVQLEKMPIHSILQETIRIQEEPFGDPSIAAHGLLMDAAQRSRVPVILGGQGGDELLFGYHSMRDALLATWLRKGKLRKTLAEAFHLRLKGDSVLRVGLAALSPHIELSMRQQSRLRRRMWLTPALREAGRNGQPQLAAPSKMSSIWLEVVERTALPHLTHYDDRNGMRRSIEGRMPFLDHRLAEVIGSLNDEALLGHGRLKRILRDVCSDLLPPTVMERRDKIGFFTPLRDMLSVEREWVQQTVTDEFARSLNYYDVDKIRSLVDAGTRADCKIETALCVWRALSVRLWAETFRVAPLSGA